MSASLVRKALDETTLASEEKFETLSKINKKSLKPPKKKKSKVSQDKILEQSLKILKALDSKPGNNFKEAAGTGTPPQPASSKNKSKKSRHKNKSKSESVFTEEDFEKFEKEYFVS